MNDRFDPYMDVTSAMTTIRPKITAWGSLYLNPTLRFMRNIYPHRDYKFYKFVAERDLKENE